MAIGAAKSFACTGSTFCASGAGATSDGDEAAPTAPVIAVQTAPATPWKKSLAKSTRSSLATGTASEDRNACPASRTRSTVVRGPVRAGFGLRKGARARNFWRSKPSLLMPGAGASAKSPSEDVAWTSALPKMRVKAVTRPARSIGSWTRRQAITFSADTISAKDSATGPAAASVTPAFINSLMKGCAPCVATTPASNHNRFCHIVAATCRPRRINGVACAHMAPKAARPVRVAAPTMRCPGVMHAVAAADTRSMLARRSR
mmetsp:Transcript_3161/g.9235  ORF Transcript_3161/g.9235 Transcript_3161/m.9235 type:complete len:261 (+) Transcript_3161:1171-1953(+)